MDNNIFSILWVLLKFDILSFIYLLVVLLVVLSYTRRPVNISDNINQSTIQKSTVLLLIIYGAFLFLAAIYIIHKMGWKMEPDPLKAYFFANDPIAMLIISSQPLISMLAGVVFVLYLFSGYRGSGIGICKSNLSVWKTLLVIFLGLLIVIVFSYLYNFLFPSPNEIGKLVLQLNTSLEPPLKYYHVAVIFLIGPIIEELFFRGVVCRILECRVGIGVGILLQAVLFSAMHNEISVLVPMFIFGLVLGFSRYLTSSVAPAILIHVLYMLVLK